MKPDLTRPVDFTTYNGTDKVCTRDGRPWRSLGKIKNSLFIIIGAVLHPNGFETVYGWDDKGRMDEREERGNDLFYALPEKVEKTFWIVVADKEIRNGQLEKTILYEKKIKTPRNDTQIASITVLVEE